MIDRLGTMALGMVVASLLAMSCSSSKTDGPTTAEAGADGVDACSPGATQACVGKGACAGGQVCLSNGSSWGPCECGDGAAGGPSSTGGSAASGGAAGTAGSNGVAGGGGDAGISNGGAPGGSAGSTGSGGGPPLICPGNTANVPLDKFISTFEGEEPMKVLLTADAGSWKTETDGTGAISAAVEEDPQGYGNALHFVGNGHTSWGGDVAVTFITPTDAIDATSFYGLTAFVTGTITNGTLYAKLQNPDSLLLGCGCDPSPAAVPEKACYGGYLNEIPLFPSEWREHSADWLSFMAGPYGYHRSSLVDRKNLLNLAFVVQSNGLGPVSWDIWIDDVQFSSF